MLNKVRTDAIRKDLDRAETRLPALFRALGDPVRFKVFMLLMRHRNLCVSDIANVLNVSVPAASYHLKALELVGLARRERDGKTVCYVIRDEDPTVKAIMRLALAKTLNLKP